MICSKKSPVVGSAARSSSSRRSSGSSTAGAAASPPAQRRSGHKRPSSESKGVLVRHMRRSPDDGYRHDLVPGLRSSVDAARLADELAFSAARLRRLRQDPPGLYGEAAAAEDREEAAWLLFQIVFFSPLEGEDPWASIREARTSWASGELPRLEGAQFGPRTAHDPRHGDAAPAAYRAWAERNGGQVAALAGEQSWTPQHRFERVFERLGFPGFGRPHRIELLATAGALGLVEVDVWSLQLRSAAATDPVAVTAKRLMGLSDQALVRRRLRELASATGVPVAAFDLAFYNWASPDPEARVTAGVSVDPDPDERELIADALGVA